MMTRKSRAGAMSSEGVTCVWCILLSMVAGCSSWLDISETPESRVVTSNTAKGVALNRRQEYQVEVNVDGLCELAFFYSGLDCIQIQPAGDKLVGVDHHHLLIVSAIRMPFSFAGLTIKLSDKQIAKEIGLDSKTGAASVPSAASAALDAKTEREKIKLEAKEKEEQAQ